MTKQPPVDPYRIEPYEVVTIETGHRWLPAYMQETYRGQRAYHAADLRKDGTPKAYGQSRDVITPDSRFVHAGDAAPFVAEREALAAPLRWTLRRLSQEIEDTEAALLALYTPKEAPDA